MKKLIILASLITLSVSAQNKISVSVLQDLKLGVGADKKHKNDTPTLDLIANVNFEGKQFEWYYFSMQAQFEYANLYDGKLTRYSIHAMWTLNKLIIPKMKVSTGFGLGMINRPGNEGNGSYSFTTDLSYPIYKSIGFVVKNEWVRRTDLKTPKLGYNLSTGLTYNF